MLSDIYSYRAIGEKLGTAGQPTEPQFQEIQEAGFHAVINLALPTSDNAIPHEQSLVHGLGMYYCHIPVEFKAPTSDDFQSFCKVMDALENQRVFVHCAANMRVSVFVFVYRVLRKQASYFQAQEDMLAIWEPDEVWSRFIQEQLEQGRKRSDSSSV
jgi:protein tyrosine phosphatase (PTP) superfamily phosphohydrolase (DUF442 family)